MIAPATKIHPLTGEPKEPQRKAATFNAAQHFTDAFAQGRARLTFDAARDGTDLDGHWRHADSLDPDSAHSQAVRFKLAYRSRYEEGSNGYYAGILKTHVNMIFGRGPTLRMLTKNRDFNQLVEREFYAWAQAVQLRRKLWCMGHARYGDGDAYGLLVTNPLTRNRVQLDIQLLETEQVQSPFGSLPSERSCDGIHYDEWNNVTFYDILPEHPGGSQWLRQQAEQVPAAQVIHWFKLKRAAVHHGIPDMTPTLPLGAMARRHREATVAAAETAADYSLIMKTQMSPDQTVDEVAPFSPYDVQRRQMMFAPIGWEPYQMKGEHPNAQYNDFHRANVSEMARPLLQPYNAAAGDSSTYSFASGKLDTLCYRGDIDIERCDCDDLVLDRIFAAWFAEWTIVANRRDIPPDHQWDWPLHPVIDAVAEANATNTKLLNGSVTLRQVYSDAGRDFEDELTVMAEDWFGEATDETIAKARQLMAIRNVPAAALPYAAQIMGIQLPTPSPAQPAQAPQPEEVVA